MSILATTLLAGSSFFAPGLSQSERLEKLKPHFAPPPGTHVQFTDRSLREFNKPGELMKLKGYIKINPPKANKYTKEGCWILRNEDEEMWICEPKEIQFGLNSLDKFGYVRWMLITGEKDFGTRLLWKTPYRAALSVPFHLPKSAAPEYRIIEECKAWIDASSQRRINLKIFGGETWSFRFPKSDTMLPQPPPAPNLYIDATGKRISVKDAAEKKRIEEQKALEEAQANAADGEVITIEDIRKRNAEQKEFDEVADRQVWGMPTRDSYEMTAENVVTRGDAPSGTRSKCRYRFRGTSEDLDDKHVGRIECHGVDYYSMIYAPLSCINEIGPVK